jgi:hypothetical protein
VCSGGSFDCALCLEVCEEAHGVRVGGDGDIGYIQAQKQLQRCFGYSKSSSDFID